MTVTVRRQSGLDERVEAIESVVQQHPSRRSTAAAPPEPAPWFDVFGWRTPRAGAGEAGLRSIVAAHERERRRIARDLHDVVGQALTAVRLHLELIRRDARDGASVTFEAGEAIELLDEALREVRDLSFEIRPSILDDLGLAAAARSLVARQARIAGLEFVVHADLLDERPDLEIEAACYRTLQEALTNVIRHAAARLVEVSLELRGGALVLTVRDDGVGFVVRPIDPDASGRTSMGLLGVWERIALVGGSMSIDSTPGEGTVLRAVFPLGPAVRRGGLAG